MASQEEIFKQIIAHAKEYGFIFPSSEIYDGLSAVYDYAQLGVELKNNIKQYWWRSMVQMHENIVGIDSAIFMHPTIWKASGHVDAFNDPLIDNKDSKKRYRADVLIEDYILKLEEKNEKEVTKAKKKFEDFNEELFRATNPNILRNKEKIDNVSGRFAELMNASDLAGIKTLIEELGIACPISGTKNWTDVRQFNLMFSTQMGSVSEGADTIYLRPETAQGIFVNFLNVYKTGRMREFEQMEMQFFVRPGEELKWFEYWKEERKRWHTTLGISEEMYRFHDHEKLAHYANAATDIEFKFPFGFKELEGIHSRTDFDLRQHEEFSGKKLRYFDPETNESYVPYVVETSIGVDRMFLAVLSHAFQEEQLPDGSSRTVLRIPRELAPVKAAVLPLVKKDGHPEKAREIFNLLKTRVMCQYDEKDAIGRRYRRQDAIGTPYCITIDNQTLEDNTVTIRDRDTMEQQRISADKLLSIII